MYIYVWVIKYVFHPETCPDGSSHFDYSSSFQLQIIIITIGQAPCVYMTVNVEHGRITLSQHGNQSAIPSDSTESQSRTIHWLVKVCSISFTEKSECGFTAHVCMYVCMYVCVLR